VLLHTAPIILINHALTGNSQVIGESGWWNDIVGVDKTIDTRKYTIVSFDVPGGFNSGTIENYRDFIARDIARIFIEGLRVLEINKLFALIGGSVGGGIAWEILALEPKLLKTSFLLQQTGSRQTG
jgi:homoserine acetyltransferase